MLNNKQMWVDIPVPYGCTIVQYRMGINPEIKYRFACSQEDLPKLLEWADAMKNQVLKLQDILQSLPGLQQPVNSDECKHSNPERRLIGANGTVMCLDCNAVIEPVNHGDSQAQKPEETKP